MNDPDNIHGTEQDVIEKKVRRAVAANALRKIGVIVAEDQRVEEHKAKVLRWFLRFGLIILIVGMLLLTKFLGFV